MAGYSPAKVFDPNYEHGDYCFKHECGEVATIFDPSGPVKCLQCIAEATEAAKRDRCQEDLQKVTECPNCGTCDNPKVCQGCGYCSNCQKYHFQLKAQLWPVTYIYYVPLIQPLLFYQPWYNTGDTYTIPASSFTFTTSSW